IVAILQTHLPTQAIGIQTILEIGHGYVFLAPHPHDHNKYGKRKEDVAGYPAQHDDQPLPGGFTTELPGLGRLLHLLFVHALVDHAGDLDITAKGYPAETIFGVTDLSFEKREPGVEEQV